jgi:hypothetical protein
MAQLLVGNQCEKWSWGALCMIEARNPGFRLVANTSCIKYLDIAQFWTTESPNQPYIVGWSVYR